MEQGEQGQVAGRAPLLCADGNGARQRKHAGETRLDSLALVRVENCRRRVLAFSQLLLYCDAGRVVHTWAQRGQVVKHPLNEVGVAVPMSLVQIRVVEKLTDMVSFPSRHGELARGCPPEPLAPHRPVNFLALLAQTYGNAGQIQAGLEALAEALAFTSNMGERYYEAELYRLKGELFLQGSSAQPCISKDRVEAEACFHRAIAIARQQSAKSLELRATFSLARLWGQQGKKEVARQILSRLHEAYTEGFDIRDWQQAKDLLNSLV